MRRRLRLRLLQLALAPRGQLVGIERLRAESENRDSRLHFALEDRRVLLVKQSHRCYARAVPEVADDRVAEQKEEHQQGVVLAARVAEGSGEAVEAHAVAVGVADAVGGAVLRRRAGDVAE